MQRIAFLVLSALLLALPAKAQDVDTRLCNHAWPSTMSQGSIVGEKITDWAVTTISECQPLTIKSLGTPDPKLATALKAWADELWQAKTMELTDIYRYRLTIVNDGGVDATIGLFASDFLFSPYTAMVKDFGFRVPPCTKLTMSFLGAGGPTQVTSKFAIAGPHHASYGHDWHVHSGGTSAVILPIWHLNHPEGVRQVVLHKTEAKSLACR